MSANEYLQGILTRESVDTGPFSSVRSVQSTLHPLLSQWGNGYLLSVNPSGSFAKGTANKSGTDIDLFLSVSAQCTNSLKEIYESLYTNMNNNSYSPRRQNVSIRVRVNGYDVDLVPGKQQNPFSLDHSLWRRKAETWTKTNVAEHIKYVQSAYRINETRILKLWRDQKRLDFPSFYLEMVVIEALSGAFFSSLTDNVWKVFHYLRDTFPNARFVDPANTNNIISEDLSTTERATIKAAAVQALAARDWGQIVT